MRCAREGGDSHDAAAFFHRIRCPSWRARSSVLPMSPGRPQASIESALEWMARLYGPFTDAHRLEATALTTAEARLGVKLPRALREYYRVTGSHPALNRTHNRLIEPARIGFVVGPAGEQFLVFYEENQEVVVWGIPRADLGLEDPPVWQCHVDVNGTWSFYPEAASVSELVCAQAAWNAVQGALPYVGVKSAEGDEGELARLRADLGLPDFRSAGLDAWLSAGGVFVMAGTTYAGVATHSREAFDALLDRFAEVEWDYTTLEDLDDE
jgi:hypothetical protein